MHSLVRKSRLVRRRGFMKLAPGHLAVLARFWVPGVLARHFCMTPGVLHVLPVEGKSAEG